MQPGILQPAPQDAQYKAYLDAALASVPTAVRQYIANTYAGTQVSVLPLPYWSTIAFEAAIAAGVGTVAAGVRQAFAYAIGGNRNVAGFAGAAVATEADTNLLRPNETRDNSDIWIWGISAYKTQGNETDDVLAGAIWRQTSLSISLNGTQSIPLGTLELFPAAGGLFGTGRSQALKPPTNVAGQADGGQGAQLPFANNGYPAAGNFFRLPQPFKWSAVGTAASDSSLIIAANLTRPVAVPVTATRAAVPIVALVTPGTIEPSTAPTAVDLHIRFHLHCVAVAKRSLNV